MANLYVFVALVAALGVAHAVFVAKSGYTGRSYAGHYNPGGLPGSVVPAINVRADGPGPASGYALVGPSAVLRGSSETVYASTGADNGHAQAGANLAYPSTARANIPASAVLRI